MNHLIPDVHLCQSPHHRRPAFTLVELLVVISIIALLLALLLPSLGASRQTAKAMICKSNQRQLLIATSMYHHDYREYFPQPFQDSDIADSNVSGEALWFNALDYYLQQAAKDYDRFDADERNYRKFKQDPVWDSWDQATRDGNRTFKMNVFFGHRLSSDFPSVKFYRLDDVSKAGDTVLFIDGRAKDTPSVTTGNTDGDEFFARPIYVGLRHDEGANVAFVDGHVAHHRNAIRQMPSGYRGWFDDDDATIANRPDVIFNFRP